MTKRKKKKRPAKFSRVSFIPRWWWWHAPGKPFYLLAINCSSPLLPPERFFSLFFFVVLFSLVGRHVDTTHTHGHLGDIGREWNIYFLYKIRLEGIIREWRNGERERERNNRLILFFAVKEEENKQIGEREEKKAKIFQLVVVCHLLAKKKPWRPFRCSSCHGWTRAIDAKENNICINSEFLLFVPSDHLRIRWGDSSRKARGIKFTTTIEMIWKNFCLPRDSFFFQI